MLHVSGLSSGLVHSPYSLALLLPAVKSGSSREPLWQEGARDGYGKLIKCQDLGEYHSHQIALLLNSHLGKEKIMMARTGGVCFLTHGEL